MNDLRQNFCFAVIVTLKVLLNFNSYVFVSMSKFVDTVLKNVAHFFMSVEIVLEYPDGLQLPNIVSMINERIKEAKVRDEVMGDI